MLVQDLMSTDVVTIHVSGTLREAVELQLEEEVGSVIVVSDEDNPIGIVTESDILEAMYETGDALSNMDVAEFRHRPVITTKPSATISYVAHRMATNAVKKVPVMDDLELVGIITLTDIVWHLSEIRKEASALGEAYSRWNPNN